MALVSSKLEVISKNQMSQLHEGSMEILSHTGVVIHHEEAREIMKKGGARVDGEVVFIDEKMVSDALDSAPSTYKHHAINPDQSISIGHRQKKLAFSGIYGCVYVLDPDEGRRPGTLEDYSRFIKLFQATDIVTVVGGLQVDPSDADKDKKFFQMMHEIIRHSDKSWWGFPGRKRDVENMFKMVKMALGQPSDAILDKSYVSTAICPLSPLRYTLEHGDSILTYAKHSQPLYFNSCIMCGASGPISMMGTAIVMNAEILAGIVLAQLVNPGTPVVYEPGGTVADLKRGMYTGGGPESNLVVIAGLQMALDMYRLPTRVMGGLSDAKEVDYQAGAETIQNLLMPLMAGAHFLNNGLGNMDGQLTTSFEKFMMDIESIERVIRVMNGINNFDQDPALDIIKEVGHRGDYLMHKSTFDNYKTRWRPTLSNWDDYQRWQRLGSVGILTKARQAHEKILAEAPETMIAPELDKDLAKFVETVEPVGDGN